MRIHTYFRGRKVGKEFLIFRGSHPLPGSINLSIIPPRCIEAPQFIYYLTRNVIGSDFYISIDIPRLVGRAREGQFGLRKSERVFPPEKGNLRHFASNHVDFPDVN